MHYYHAPNHIRLFNDEGTLLAEVKFPRIDDNTVEINRTFVDPSLRGQGIAHELLMYAYNAIKSQGLKAIPTCSYALTWFKRNTDKNDILAPNFDLEDNLASCSI
ncbi:N-acetyltransferase [Acholeplasma vituli]|uniref:N-acetyltransferase n=1 Tax=Paracholeplasma vituli TaxID=69473 RepID=A0ABT2PXP5_9MOLU|nr:GNAT family N-acetyltransferase [Paracholeplasma vituli]MCU0105731.1 N-acetyltransferase [Paracholeplasma vituli]